MRFDSQYIFFNRIVIREVSLFAFIRGMIVLTLICGGFISCDIFEGGSQDAEIDNQWLEVLSKVQTAIDHDDDNIAFIFFTDPHLLGALHKFSETEKSRLESSFANMKEIYDLLPVSFCLCGGDWLTSGDTQTLAKQKLLFSDRIMKELFPQYLKMMGNHDTNYQGVVSSNNSSRGDLPSDFISNDYFSEVGSPYYLYKSNTTAFFILDSGLDWDIRMDDYRWAQIDWLAGVLEEQDHEHVILGLHMVFESGKLTPMSEELVKLCDAYNHNGAYSSRDVEFSFANKSGAIHTIISGHSHEDSISFVGVDKDIPVIQTCNYTKDRSHSFDICTVDYSLGYLDLSRIGIGVDRSVKLAKSK